MAENPLLPDDELRRLYRLLKQNGAGAVRRTGAGTHASPPVAALATACTMQMQRRDVLALPSTPWAERLGDRARASSPVTFPITSRVPAEVSILLAAASIASAQQSPQAGPQPGGQEHQSDLPLTLALAEAGQPDCAWKSALTWAQQQRLPLLSVLIERQGENSMLRRPTREAGPGWTAVDRLCRQLQMPVLTVDGADAVATYRVMQESALRARAGGGPAVLWAVLPSPVLAEGSPGPTPLAQLARYLKVRRIPLP